MKPNERGAGLPQSVARKLRAIRRRAVGFTFLRGLILAGAVLLAAMVAAMLIDWSVGWFNPAARYAVTSLALGGAAVAFIIWCALPLLHRRTIVSTAREVDESLPQLEERWSTVTELSQSTDAPEVRGSEAMIRKVASEAELASENITPQKVISSRPVLLAGRWLAGAVAVLLILCAVNFTQTRLLAQREVDSVAGGYAYAEGPLWHPDGYLLFADSPRDRLHKWDRSRSVRGSLRSIR